jgi:hypothetical protein
MQWIDANVSEFSPWAPDHLAFDPARLKRFGELAVTLTAVTSITGTNCHPGLTEARRLLAREYRDGPLVDFLLRPLQPLVQLMHLCLAMQVVLDADEGTRLKIQNRLAAGLLHGELHRHGLVEARMCLDWLGFNEFSLLPMEKLLGESVITRFSSALTMREDDVYELTHVLMFASRYGTVAPSTLLPGDVLTDIQGLLADLLICLAQAEHWDLLGEVLVCWDALQFGPTSIYSLAWRSFLASQNEDGSFPASRAMLQRHAREKNEALRPDPVPLNYHTSLVGVIAGCIALQRASMVSLLELPGG